MTRSRILGLIAVLWGGAVLVFGLLGPRKPVANAAYAAGQNTGLFFGVLLLIVGLYYLLRRR